MMVPADPLKMSFPPVVDDRTRLLLLGSLPGEQSLARGQYYANPRNQFWRLLTEILGTDLVVLNYEQRLAALLAARIGLWDSIASATRQGSLDTSIRAHRANELTDLVGRLPSLTAVAFNGAASARIGERALGDAGDFARLALPSSSPAYTLPFDRKLEQWRALRDFL